MSWLVAGIATAGSAISSGKANQADREAGELEKFQNLIDVERMKGDVALNTFNMRQDLSALESEQVAMSSAMGKSSEGAGFQRMQEVGRDDMESNITRMNEEVARAQRMGKISSSAIDKRTSASSSQRNIKTGTMGLMSYAKAFA